MRMRKGPEALFIEQVDREKSGFLTPEAIHAFLADVGLEATPFDMRHIMAELDPEHSGNVSRASFINFIRYGGQHAPPPKVLHFPPHCTMGNWSAWAPAMLTLKEGKTGSAAGIAPGHSFCALPLLCSTVLPILSPLERCAAGTADDDVQVDHAADEGQPDTITGDGCRQPAGDPARACIRFCC